MTFSPYANYREVEGLGAVPSHWKAPHMKRIARLTYGDALALDLRDPEGEIAVYGSNGPVGVHVRANTLAPAILVGRKGSCGALNWSADPVFGIDTVYFIDSQTSSEHLRWLFWTLHTLGLSNFSQDTGVPGLARELAHELKLPTPPQPEQTAIAAFLDRETGKIDNLVEAQRQLIDLLKEKRRAVISHAVTKGMDSALPMKDAGVEWLGDVPAHWHVKALKRVTETCCDGPFGSGLKSEHYVDDGVRVVRLQNIKEQGFDGNDAAFIDTTYFETTLSRHDVRVGDVLIAGLGDERNLVGRACVAPLGIEPAMVKADCFRFRLSPNMDAEFIAYQLNAGAEYASGKMSTGSTRSRIALSSMMERVVVIPPLGEQREIVARLSLQVKAITALFNQAGAAITLLLERRAALISAAVTGKIDVRGHAEAPSAIDQATARRLVGAAVLELVANNPASGRMTSAKRMYLAEAHADVWELRGQPERMAAGPFDREMMREVEAELARVGHIATSQPGGSKSQVFYSMIGKRGALRADLVAMLGDRRLRFENMLADLGALESKGVEGVATLFAVWNDMLIDGQTPTDDAVIDGVLNDWHADKRDKFTRPDLVNYLGWMRRHDLTPSGRGPRTKSGTLL